MATSKQTSVLTTPTAKATTTLEDQSPVLPLPDTPQGMLAVGPRVTFRFVQDYDQENSYEYYDVVNVDGTSYIAMQNVPANTPIADTDYWVKWNDPNAQFALLQETVQTFDARITDNTNNISSLETELETVSQSIDQKYAVFIGDSYSVTNGSVTGWITPLANLLAASGWTVKSSGMGGYGFARPGKTFATLLQNLAATLNDDEKKFVKVVLVAGGYNDNTYSQQDIESGMSAFNDAVSDNFPNAIVKVAFIGCGISTQAASQRLIDTQNNYSLACINNGFDFKPGYDWMWLSNDFLLEDGFHPNQNGVSYIVNNLLNFIYGNNYVSRVTTAIQCTPTEDVALQNNPIGFDYFTKTIVPMSCKITPTSSSQSFQVGTLEFIPADKRVVANCNIKLSDNTYKTGVVEINVNSQGQIYVYVDILNAGNTGYISDFVEINLVGE